MTIDDRTKPTHIQSVIDLKDFYWLKSELIKHCSYYGLSTSGSKEALIKRLECFFNGSSNLIKNKPKYSSSVLRDSDSVIKRDTLVKYYKNDAATRTFFIKHIGPSFKFNQYLRRFSHKDNITPGLTYGDLVEGYLAFEEERLSGKGVTTIDRQFEYNQFIRDYFKQEPQGSLKEAIAAWKTIKSHAGPNTYVAYLALSLKSKS